MSNSKLMVVAGFLAFLCVLVVATIGATLATVTSR